jgi:hypothetical protein
VRLVADASCVDRRSYRLEIEGVDLRALGDRLGAMPDVSPEHAPPGVLALRTADGHVVLLVLATGRIQIRIDLAVPRAERRWAAEAIAVRVARVLAVRP